MNDTEQQLRDALEGLLRYCEGQGRMFSERVREDARDKARNALRELQMQNLQEEVARRVFGCVKSPATNVYYRESDGLKLEATFYPQHKIDDAWLVVTEMERTGWRLSINAFENALCFVYVAHNFCPSVLVSIGDNGVCRAICLAALDAVEVGTNLGTQTDK